MKTKTTILSILLVSSLFICGCKSKDTAKEPSQEPKTQTLDQIKQEIQKLDIDSLKEKAEEYKNAIVEKKDDLAKLMEKYKEIPASELLSDEFKNLKTQIDDLTKNIKDLTDKFKVYVDELKNKGEDTKELESDKVFDI